MYRRIFCSLFLSLALSGLWGQSAEPIPSVDALEFMAGTWEGPGWMLGRDREQHHFQQTEVIQSKSQGEALMVNGLGYALDSAGNLTDRVIHEAFGLISLNPEKGGVTMLSFTPQQGRMESDLELLGEKRLRWGFVEEKSGRYIRFTEDFSQPGLWQERGEISRDGETWFPFFEMTLQRQ